MVAGASSFNESDTSTVPNEPPNQMLHFPRSDGRTENRPINLDSTANADGMVDFQRPVGINEPANQSWRMKVGNYVAKELGKDSKKLAFVS